MKQIACPACSAKFDVSAYPPGKRFRCGRCKEILTVPEDALADELMAEADYDEAPAPAEAGGEAAAVEASAEEQAAPAVTDEAQAEPEPEAEPAPRPAARAGARSARGRGGRPAPRAADTAEEGDAPEPLPQKMSPLPKILAAVVVLAVLGGGGFFAWKQFGGKGGKGGDGTVATADEYAKRLKKLEKTSGIDNLRLALWCKAAGHDKYEFHLAEAARLAPNDAQVKSGLAESYWTRAATKPPATAADCLGLTADAAAAGMAGEKRRLARVATMLEPDNAAAWEALDCVRYEPETGGAKWLSRAEAGKAKAADEALKTAREKVGLMTPREKRIAEMKLSLSFEFGPEFVSKDEKPFLFCMEKSAGFNAELVLDSYVQELKAFYNRFFDRYGEKFKLGDLTDQVMLIWIFQSREAYFKYGSNIGIPANAGGHWEGATERLMIFHSTDPTADPYGTIFHETTHMIVTFATKLRGKVSSQMFWFTEGLATYFEPFERDKATGKIVQNIGTVNQGRMPAIKQWLGINRHVKLKDLLSWKYGEFSAMNVQHNNRRDLAWGAYCYAEAWSILYFFYNYENGKYVSKFEQYFQEELNGNSGVDSFKKIFGDDLDTLEKEWSEFTKSLR